jgi:alkanesulfonate monooxygenase SsuD/methylene tetrahydromethanopterin reductase-like flavin-dependent oxidoreductase (luciferase family)
MGLEEEVGRAASAHAAAHPADVPEHFVRAVAAFGDPAAARARLEEYRSAGADLVVVYPVIVPGSALARSALTTLESLAPNG